MKKTITFMVGLFFLGFTYLMHGQGITTAAINGKVTSKTNSAENAKLEAGIGVVIKAVHLPSGTEYAVETNTSGRFNIPGMRIGGPYRITANMIGMKAKPQDDIYLELGDNFEVDFTMVEETTQLDEVVVKAPDNIMNSDRTGAGTNIRKEQFERLPSLNRSIQDFTILTPQAGNAFSFGGRSQLYNNFAIDGATSGNLFGLSALPGGQSAAQPISLDALQEVKIVMAPYDVRQGNFTGVAVNAVTRSGTNEFSGSVYGFGRNQGMLGNKVAGQTQTNTNFSYYNGGVRLGGPIIKNRLFFFANYEYEDRTEPGALYNAATPGAKGNNVATVSADSLNQLSDFLKTKYNYNPGPYTGFNRIATHSDKGLVKFDLNISKIHKLSIKYNFLLAYQDAVPSGSGGAGAAPAGGRGGANLNYVPFESAFYRINNQLHSVIGELNSTFNSRFSNTLQIGYSAFRDFRTSFSDQLNGSGGNFPLVDIVAKNGSGLNATSFGYEPFTYKNTLNQDVFQFSNNFNIYQKDHVFSVGFSAEYIHAYNLFWPQRNPVYQYNSFKQFMDNANGVAGTSPSQFLYQYGISGSPAYSFNTATLGFYGQDEYTGIKNLKLVLGLRVDVPMFLTKLQDNPTVDAMTFNNGEKINLGKLPNTTPLLSPRIGFNWDVTGDKKTQVRGGTGLFTGRIPYVWVGNQAGNNGLLLGQINASGTAAANYNFNPNSDAYAPANPGIPPTYAINSVVQNFKFPQVWRTNIAIDRKLFWDMIGTLEFIYTKDVNAVYYRNANQVAPTAGTIEGDGRPYYPVTPQLRNINQSITQALVLDNTNKGYQWSITAQVQKTFAKGFYASAAYTYTDSRDISSAAGNSTAGTFWASNPYVGNMNTPTLSYSSSLTPHRIIATASYKKEYLKHFATTFSLVYDAKNLAVVNGFQTSVYSYTYGGDPTFSNFGSNQSLMYIPKSESDIALVPASATDTRTPDQIWNQLDAYIKQDSYLNSHRGEYAARNGVVAPLFHRVDIRVLQDIYTSLGKITTVDESGYSYKGKRNSLQLSFEVVNVLNLLNSNWGVIQTPSRTQLLNFVGYESPAVVDASGHVLKQPSGRPEFTFPTVSDPNNATKQIPLTSTYRNDVGINSRYQIQLGIRYIFN